MVRLSVILVVCAVVGCLGDPAKPHAQQDAASQSDAHADAPMGSGETVFGDTTIESGTDQHTCGVPEAASFKTTDTVVDVHSLWIYLADYAGDDARGLDAAIYDTGSNGEPTMLLASGTKHGSAQLARGQWHQIPLTMTFHPLANHIYWIAAMCPMGYGNMFSIQYKYFGATGVGACDATQTQCTEHGRDSETSFDASWSNYAEFKPSTNSYYASSQ